MNNVVLGLDLSSITCLKKAHRHRISIFGWCG